MAGMHQPSDFQVFRTLDRTSNARLLRSSTLSDGLALAHWYRDEAEILGYSDPGHHTLSLYLQGGWQTFRRDRPGLYGGPDRFCVMPAEHHSDWAVTRGLGFMHLYISPERLAGAAVRTLDCEPRSLQLEERTYIQDEPLAALCRTLERQDWNEPGERLLCTSLAHQAVDHLLLTGCGRRTDVRWQGGLAAHVRRRLADYIEERNALRGKILTAFIYPAVVGVVSIGIVIFLLGYVVPQVVSAFSQARQDLPALTRAMLQDSDFVRAWGWLCAGAIGSAYWGWRLYLRDPQARLGWHRRVLRLPLLGRFVLGVNTARFASTLAILGSAGVPLLRALDAARQTLANDCLAQAVEEATAQVREGVSLASALRTRQVFPPILTHLIASGEKTGALPPMLDRAAQTLSRDIERRAMGMTALLEPLMIVVMGGVVLTIVMAVLMPIIEMNQLVQ